MDRRRAVHAKTQEPFSLRVVAIEELTATIRKLRLAAADGQEMPPASAGAHLRFQLPLAGTGPSERCYSLVSRPNRPGDYEIAVHRDPRSAGGSQYMHGLSVGDALTAIGPKNDFGLAEEADHSILIAGGIGITPILSMACELERRRASFFLHYACRTPEAMAYRAEAERFGAARARLYFDGGCPEEGLQLPVALASPKPGTHIYVCGPRPLIDATIATARNIGWGPDQIHFELFSNGVVSGGDRLQVELRRSKLTLDVRPEQSILDAMIEAGCDPMFDCKRGECGACSVKVLEGQAEHHDYCLSEDDRADNMMCVCVSRARSMNLVLDA